MIYNNQQFQIYFGDATDKLHPSFYLSLRQKLKERPEFAHVFELLKLEQLALADLLFQEQTHSTQGAVITQQIAASMLPFDREGDFLVTNQPNIGLGIMAADCVPVVCIDNKYNSAGIAHAGWRGAVAGVVESMITAMSSTYGSQLSTLQFFIGPSAKKCCYEVSPDFLTNLADFSYKDTLIKRENGKIYFDVSELIYHQLITLGVTAQSINTSHNLCTMCNERFYSHRRGTLAGNAELVGRQMTVVVLR